MLIYKIIFSLLLYIFYGRGLKGRAGYRPTDVQTNIQTDEVSDLRQELANKQINTHAETVELRNHNTS